MPFLQITTKNGRVYTSLLAKNETTIGRSTENDIVLHDHTVSRCHARIARTKKGYVLTDLGSFNGTRLNEKPVQTALLANQDRITIGLAQIVFLSAEKAPLLKPDTVILSNETNFECGRERIVKSSPEARRCDSQALLVSAESKNRSAESDSHRAGNLSPREGYLRHSGCGTQEGERKEGGDHGL